MRACACVYLRVGARACAFGWARLVLLIQHAKSMRPYSHLWPVALPYFSTLSPRRRDFRKKVTERKM